MNAGKFAPLLGHFAKNWSTNAPDMVVSITDNELDVKEGHPLYGELVSLCKGCSTSLPFFAKDNRVVWCTIAPETDSLRQSVASLYSWVIPSFGGEEEGDGYVQPMNGKGALASAIILVSPSGYYRWSCPRDEMPNICDKLRLRHSLEAVRPARTRPPRPSLYEMRARFATALLIGDRIGAEEIIQLLDTSQLETAINTQFMRIRLWHHFREIGRIREHPDLPHLLAQPIPPRVREWINDAIGLPVEPGATADVPPPPAASPPRALDVLDETQRLLPHPVQTWLDWFILLESGNRDAAQSFLREQTNDGSLDFSANFIETISNCLDNLVIDDTVRIRERALILQGVSEILEAYVREPAFPRAALGGLYLSFLRLWCVLHAGNTAGQEHGHVLLELSSALLQLNENTEEVCQTLESWWQAKPSPSQLYFALDAIELLERELPGTEAPADLWLAAADVIIRASETLPVSDRALWRRIGKRLGFDEATILQYLPPELHEDKEEDPLASGRLNHVAIVCLRKQQAEQAAAEIHARSGAKVTVVLAMGAGAETSMACTADVVLFVWMASTHAVFRAFDDYDRLRFCYVQGTGSSSIVQTLERWTMMNAY
jgi:hypothetical protein